MTFDSGTTYYRKARDGQAFVVSEAASVASGGTLNVHLKNPTSRDMRYWVMDITVSSTGTYKASISDTFSSAPSGGTEAKIENVLLDTSGGDDDGTGVANKDVSYTSSGEHAVGVGGGGEGGNSVGMSSSHPPVVVEEGREIVIEVENISSESNRYAITVVYYETTMNDGT